MRVGGTAAFWRVKRVGDVLLSLALIPALICVGTAILFLNPALNPGTLLFLQERIGLHGRTFVMLKFRTMQGNSGSARFASEESHRVTRFGSFLRRYRIDELPQVINVLRGEMSLIGPRPEQPGFVEVFRVTMPGYHLRHVIKPGVSGLSQVMEGYTSDTDGTQRKLALDLRYIRRSGFRLEAFILWRTLVTVVTGFGAR